MAQRQVGRFAWRFLESNKVSRAGRATACVGTLGVACLIQQKWAACEAASLPGKLTSLANDEHMKNDLKIAEQTVRPKMPMQMYGHRGASAQAPENTAAAFNLAFERGADGVECDLQQLGDEVIVLHDTTLRRTASGDLSEALLDADLLTLRYQEVEDIDIGSWYSSKYQDERPLTFRQFLDVVATHNGSSLVEIKGGDLAIVEPVIKQARTSSVSPDKIIFIGFDLETMSAVKKAAPEFKCLGVRSVKSTWFSWWAEHSALAFARKCAELGLDGADFNAHTNVVTQRVVDYLHSKNMLCAVWVRKAPAINDRLQDWETMAERGVDLFTSNCPEEAFHWWKHHKHSFRS